MTTMKKPIIALSKPHAFFLRDGVVISDDEARALWDAGTAEWSQAAFQEMSRRVMA